MGKLEYCAPGGEVRVWCIGLLHGSLCWVGKLVYGDEYGFYFLFVTVPSRRMPCDEDEL